MWVRLLLLPAVALAAACVEPSWGPAGVTGPCSTQALRVTAVSLPGSGSEAVALGFDLDGDGVVDNQLGALSAALGAVYAGWEPERWLGERLAEREVQWLALVDRCEGERAWQVRLARGADEDRDGRPELVDDGAAAVGQGPVAGDGVGLLPVGYFADGGGLAAEPAWEDGVALTASARAAADGQLALTIGVAVALGDAALAPAAAFLTTELVAGSRFARGIDLDGDQVVSVAELRASPAVASLLGFDVDTDGDGVPDRLSLGFAARASAVELE